MRSKEGLDNLLLRNRRQDRSMSLSPCLWQFPGLSSLSLGVASGEHRRRDEEAAARAMAAQAMQMQTEQLRQRNQSAADARYRQQLSPRIAGWR